MTVLDWRRSGEHAGNKGEHQAEAEVLAVGPSERIADERAALRRVATLVGRAAEPREVFAAVIAEVGLLLDADATTMSRYGPEYAATVVATWTKNGTASPFPVGSRYVLGGRDLHTLVFDTHEPARIDDFTTAAPVAANYARQAGTRSAVGVPISVEGRVWGVILATSGQDRALPADTEERLAGFTELVAAAIANTQARLELRGYAEEQAALRRVATLVARAAPPEEVFAAVTAEVGQLLGVDFTVLGRHEPTGAVIVLGAWARSDPGRPLPVGLRLAAGGNNVHTRVFRTCRPARIDYGMETGHAADVAREWGFRSAVGAPISVEDRQWGVVIVGSAAEPLAPDIETRLARFAELVGSALANAETQAALSASRARIVAAADTTRRRIERDLHDGAQQRVVSLALQLRMVQAVVPPELSELTEELDTVADGLTDVLDELREIALGIHPAVLAEGGLRPALQALARRSAVPIRLEVHTSDRFPEPVEIAVYYAVSEALTNAAKHAGATAVHVQLATDNGTLQLNISDDGRGGADPALGSGLVGLTDRVETLGGHLSLRSPPGAGTTLRLVLPARAASARAR